MNANSISALRTLPPPKPAMGVAAYDEERRLRLAFDPRCKDNFARYRQAERGAAIDYLPIKLDIENVSRCNFRCTMCQVSEWDKGKRAEDMSVAAFQRLIDEQYGLVEIKLQGMGEPTMAGGDLFEMIAYARARHIWVRTVTNASLLHLKDNYRRLIDSDPNELQISVDGATKDVFESIRQGSVFEKVVENCKLINRYCREKGVKRTKMWVVVQETNVHQMDALVDLAVEMGFESMVFSLNLSDWGSTDWTERNRRATVEDRLSVDRSFALIERGEQAGIEVAFWNVTSKYSQKDKKSLCPWPFERAYVSSDLRVVPCCMIANPETFDLGDANRFNEVWFGETMQNFRQDHISGDLPAVCKGCYARE